MPITTNRRSIPNSWTKKKSMSDISELAQTFISQWWSGAHCSLQLNKASTFSTGMLPVRLSSIFAKCSRKFSSPSCYQLRSSKVMANLTVLCNWCSLKHTANKSTLFEIWNFIENIWYQKTYSSIVWWISHFWRKGNTSRIPISKLGKSWEDRIIGPPFRFKRVHSVAPTYPWSISSAMLPVVKSSGLICEFANIIHKSIRDPFSWRSNNFKFADDLELAWQRSF